VQPRKDCIDVEIKGAFPGADVVRGVDWNHEDKDGKQIIAHYYNKNISLLFIPSE
jgi:hypothetical protein